MMLDQDRNIRMFGLRVMSLVEGMTLLVLVGVAVPLKHLAGYPLLVSIVGPVHGLVFLFYLWVALNTIAGEGWSKGDIARVVLAAFIPGGAFLNAGFMKRKEEALRTAP